MTPSSGRTPRHRHPVSPPLGPGLHEGGTDDRAGRLGMQPILADGVRLDDMVGSRFLVATTRELYAARPGRRCATQLEENGDVVVLFDPAKVGQILEAAGASGRRRSPGPLHPGPGRHPRGPRTPHRSIPQVGRDVPAHI